jgi:hypothetical protein
VLKLIQQQELVDKDRTEYDQLSTAQAFDRNLAAPRKEILEQIIEGFNGRGTQTMKELADGSACIGVRVSAALGCDQD